MAQSSDRIKMPGDMACAYAQAIQSAVQKMAPSPQQEELLAAANTLANFFCGSK